MISQTEAKKKSLLDTFSDLEKEMIQQKKRLEKQKEEILQSKLKKQLEADAEIAKRLAE